MPNKAESSQQIEQRFLSDYRELLAHFSSQAVIEGIASFLSLNYTTKELQTASVTPGAYRKMLANALITLLNKNTLVPLTEDFSEAANADMDRLRRETGLDLELVSPPAPPPPTAEELLADEVRRDWKTLPMSKVREKKNANRAYSNMLEKLANNNTLESSVTSLRNAGA
jgi:hypothetical protein